MYYDEEDDPPDIREYKNHMREELVRMNSIMDALETKAKTLIGEQYDHQLKTLSGDGFRKLNEVMSRHLWHLTREVALIIDADLSRDDQENTATGV